MSALELAPATGGATLPDSLPSLAEVAAEIGERAAAPYADAVDADGRFPAEAMAAVRAAGLLGALVPEQWGGPGRSLGEYGEAVTALAQHCATSGLILAMHGIQVA